MSVSKRLRFEVFKRDRFTCQYCGKRPPEVMLEADHIHPRCEGGTDDLENLTTACVPCNRGKAGVPLGDVRPAVDELELLSGIQEMLERATSLRHAVAVASVQRKAEDDAVATVQQWWVDAFGEAKYVEDNAASVRKFLRSLTLDDIAAAIDATVAKDGRTYSGFTRNDRWRYFCGTCWRMIKGEGNA